MLTLNKTRVLPQVSARSFLGTLDVFKSLPPVQLAEVERGMTEKKYPKGATIFLEGDSADFVWFVKEGHVKAMAYAPNGRGLTLCMVGSKGMFGSCCCFGSSQHPCHGVAESDVTVWAYPMRDFLRLLERFPAVSRAVIETVSKRLRRT